MSAGELEQIRFLLGHASVQTTERYIGSKQKLHNAVNDRFEISIAGAGETLKVAAFAVGAQLATASFMIRPRLALSRRN